ncbi:hypothetical protein Trydic_g16846 [Trypoxylus dichotomus]
MIKHLPVAICNPPTTPQITISDSSVPVPERRMSRRVFMVAPVRRFGKFCDDRARFMITSVAFSTQKTFQFGE